MSRGGKQCPSYRFSWPQKGLFFNLKSSSPGNSPGFILFSSKSPEAALVPAASASSPRSLMSVPRQPSRNLSGPLMTMLWSPIPASPCAIGQNASGFTAMTTSVALVSLMLWYPWPGQVWRPWSNAPTLVGVSQLQYRTNNRQYQLLPTIMTITTNTTSLCTAVARAAPAKRPWSTNPEDNHAYHEPWYACASIGPA